MRPRGPSEGVQGQGMVWMVFAVVFINALYNDSRFVLMIDLTLDQCSTTTITLNGFRMKFAHSGCFTHYVRLYGTPSQNLKLYKEIYI